jgi:hypothetical protein
MSKSKFIKLRETKLSDFILLKTNRVLEIDDISQEFSSSDDPRELFANILTIDSTRSYGRFLVQIIDPSGQKYQITELVTLSDDNDIYTLTKGSITNQDGNELVADIYGYVDELNNSYLRFEPIDPYNFNYDIKILKNEFVTRSIGINTVSVGYINLFANNKLVSAASTETILSLDIDEYDSVYASLNVINSNLEYKTYVEIYLTHDGENTYLSEFYFDDIDQYNGRYIGSFTSYIDSGVLKLDFVNDSTTDTISVRTRNVGFGSTSIGVGTYRFKDITTPDGFERSVTYQSNISYTTSGNPGTVVSLDKNLFSSIKSLVKVGIGSTTSLHQLLTIHDGSKIHVSQYPFLSIGSTSGIGTFGGEYSGNNVEIKFYPDLEFNGTIEILSFNENIYSFLDLGNEYPPLEYLPNSESLETFQFFGSNLEDINRTNFELKYNGVPIFAKSFNPENTSVLDKETGIFNIQDHFFSTGEELIYTPKSTFSGIGATSVGIGQTLNYVGVVTNRLPDKVYAIKINNDQFKIATRKEYAQSGIFVTFTSNGEGNSHEFEMVKKNEKSLIYINDVAQYPLAYTSLSFNLSNNGGQIGTASSIFALSGIASVNPTDLLKVGEEYMYVKNVGLGTSNSGPISYDGAFSLVEVSRGYVGSSATVHSDGDGARIYRGSYNIVGSEIHFTNPPRGSSFYVSDLDFSNLTRNKATFNGRVFLRKNYDTNTIYDNISEKFTGLDQEYNLTVQGINTVGLGTSGGNGIVFINGIFQTPTTLNNSNNNFEIFEDTNVGVTSISFSGITDENGDIVKSQSDVNQNELPRGGVIVSLGSSIGLGYAPLVGAKVIPRLDSSGSIVNIVGTANTGNPIAFTTVSYNNQNGILDIFTQNISLLNDATQVKLVGLAFTCPSNPGIVSYFPSHNEPLNIISVGSTSFSVQVGTSTLPHNYVGYGTVYPWYSNLTFGSGYRNPVSIAVSEYGHNGTTASIISTVGAGGTLSFAVSAGGTGYTNPIISISPPSYENLSIIGVSRLGVGPSTETGTGLLLNVEVGESSVEITGVGNDVNVLGIPTTTGGRFADAASLINLNKRFIANESVNRMITNFGGYPGPGTPTDCEDDVVSVLDVINYNLQYGGNDRVYDAAKIYIDNTYLQGEEDESIYTFEQARDIAIQVMRNEAVVVSIATTEYSQVFDNSIIIDPYGIPYCSDVASAITQFVGIVTYAIGQSYLPNRVVSSASLFEVKNFKIVRPGYGFRRGDVIAPVGLVTDVALYETSGVGTPRKQFTLTVLDIFNDSFGSWQFGELNYIDSVKNYQDGNRVRFPLFYNSELLSFEVDPSDSDSQRIDLDSVLLIFVNGVLQVPGESYQFSGGTSFTFTTPPKPEDNISIFFYLGTTNEDSEQLTVSETLKIGDEIQVFSNNDLLITTITQNKRTITDIATSDRFETELYTGQGINDQIERPLYWIKQKRDLLINGEIISKTRDILESQIYPTSRVIKSIDSNSSEIFVDDISLFEYDNDNPSTNNFDLLLEHQNENIVIADVTPVVSSSGTISNLVINNSGSGYIGTSVQVKFSKPIQIGIGIGTTASAVLSIVNGQVSSPITITNPGFGYTSTNLPQTLVDPPKPKIEYLASCNDITGFNATILSISTCPGIGTDLALEFEFYRPEGLSELQSGYQIYVFDTYIGNGTTSIITSDSEILSISTSFVNNIYYVNSFDSSSGVATCNILSSTDTSSIGIGTTGSNNYPVGKMSWGRISGFIRQENPLSIDIDGYEITGGLSTYPTIQRRGYGLRRNGSIKKSINSI